MAVKKLKVNLKLTSAVLVLLAVALIVIVFRERIFSSISQIFNSNKPTETAQEQQPVAESSLSEENVFFQAKSEIKGIDFWVTNQKELKEKLSDWETFKNYTNVKIILVDLAANPINEFDESFAIRTDTRHEYYINIPNPQAKTPDEISKEALRSFLKLAYNFTASPTDEAAFNATIKNLVDSQEPQKYFVIEKIEGI